MKAVVFILFLFMSLNSFSQSVPAWKFPDLEKQFKVKDTVMVINFWATWCKPCVRELPYFEEARELFKESPVKFLLVSLDFRRELESRVIPFVAANKINSKVVLLHEPDYNSWINKVDSSWTGGIPATLILDNRNGKRTFYEKEFEEKELKNAINDLLNAEKE